MQNHKTHFGFREVNYDQKSSLVKNIFSNVAKKYDLMNDLMNDLMSAGTHPPLENKYVKTY